MSWNIVVIEKNILSVHTRNVCNTAFKNGLVSVCDILGLLRLFCEHFVLLDSDVMLSV